jgi:uncharacterized protein (TIGR03083 family)
MTRTLRRADHIRPIGHAEAMRLTAAENARLLALLRGLAGEQWQAPTDCAGWTVRDVVVHLVASAQAQASLLEFGRQAVAGRRLTAETGGRHWVDGLNEAQLRDRAGWTAATLPDRWERHAARALAARRRMPAPVRALPALPLGTGLGVHVGWQPLRYLFDMGFTRDAWVHRMDIARAAGTTPELTPGHDGRIVADILAEWSRRHGQAYTLTLHGPAGGDFMAGANSAAGNELTAGDGGGAQAVDAVEFARILSGRAEGTGILRHKLPL